MQTSKQKTCKRYKVHKKLNKMCENLSVRKIYKKCTGLTNHRQTKKKVSAKLEDVKTYKLNKMSTGLKKYFRKSRQNK